MPQWISREMWIIRSIWIPTSSDNEILEEVVRVSRIRTRQRAVVAQLEMDLGLRLNMVTLNLSYLFDLEINSLKKVRPGVIKGILKSVSDNFCDLCSNLCSRNT